jgi:hypothetical protein
MLSEYCMIIQLHHLPTWLDSFLINVCPLAVKMRPFFGQFEWLEGSLNWCGDTPI